MQISDIENMTADELKAGRDGLIEAARALDHGDVAARYVQARTDAKRRDEKLSEQGRTIQQLSDSIEDLRTAALEYKQQAEEDLSRAIDQLTDERKNVAALSKEIVDEHDASDEVAEKHAGEVKGLRDVIQAAHDRGDRLERQARKYADAITTIHKASTDAINARAIDDAGNGAGNGASA